MDTQQIIAKQELQEFDWDNIIVGDYNLDHSEHFFDIAGLSENIKLEDGSLGKIESEEQENEHVINNVQALTPPSNHCANTNIRLQWSNAVHIQRTGLTVNNAHALVLAPKAYGFKDVYQHKKEDAIRKRAEEERLARQFHSRPVPNFKACHKRLENIHSGHKITIPKTPDTVKHWQAGQERRRKLQLAEAQRRAEEEAKAKQVRSIDYLHELPFQPKKGHYALTSAKPFKLHTDQRVRQRREFDAAVQSSLEQKKKEQEEQRMKRELEEIKEIRKMTEFKARPNPFK